MVDYAELMRLLSRPRPNGSAANRQTVTALHDWLTAHGLPVRLQPFTLYPYFFLCVGAWMLGAHTLLAVSIWLRWGWISALIMIPALLGGLLDTALDVPLVTWPGRTTGHNLLMEFSPAQPTQELILSAHHDSKTELFDHHVRTIFVRLLPLGILLALLLGLQAPLQRALPPQWADSLQRGAVWLTLPLLTIVWGLGASLVLGPWRPVPSQGAVDNGTACAALLGLAERLATDPLPVSRTRVTLAIFGGEEVNMQGSRAYARGRTWPLPAAALNLEVLAQDGAYVFWEQDGTAFRLQPTHAGLNRAVSAAVARMTGSPAKPAGPINSDGYSLMRTGVPTTTLGTYDARLGSHGFHLPSDNLGRVKLERLPETVAVLAEFIRTVDAAGLATILE